MAAIVVVLAILLLLADDTIAVSVNASVTPPLLPLPLQLPLPPLVAFVRS